MLKYVFIWFCGAEEEIYANNFVAAAAAHDERHRLEGVVWRYAGSRTRLYMQVAPQRRGEHNKYILPSGVRVY